MTNELASTILEVCWAHRHAEKPLPPHLIADLQEIFGAGCDEIAYRLRNDAARLLRGEGV